MKKAMLSGFLGMLAVLLLTLPVRAEDKPAPRAWVVVAGVGEYADKQIQPRKHAEADAKALYELFTDKKYLDVDKESVTLLVANADEKHPAQAPTMENILKALHTAVTKAGKDDLVIFAFVGQGAPLDKGVCLFGSDSSFKNRAKVAITPADIEKEMKGLKSHRFLALLDVNFKGFDAGNEKVAEPKLASIADAFLGKNSSDTLVPATGRLVCLATTAPRQSVDLEKNGVFTTALIDGLKGEADKEGYEADGVVTAEELAEYLEKRVPELAREHGQTKEDKDQAPLILGSRANHFVVTHDPPAVEKAKERLEKFAKVAAKNKFDKIPAGEKDTDGTLTTEGGRLLARMPLLPAQQDLRRAYQKLADGDLNVEEFQKKREKLIADGKAARTEGLTYATKVMQAIKMVHDTHLKELNTGEMVAKALQGLYLRVGDRKLPPEVKQRLEVAGKLKDADLLLLLAEMRERLGKREELARNKDVDISLQLLMKQLDPHTDYVDPDKVREFRRMMSGAYTGIGVRIAKDEKRDEILVVSPIKGSPAHKAGLRGGDIITTIIREVDSKGKKLEKPEVIATKGLPIADAMAKVLGEAGTEVKLRYERPGVEKPIEVTIKRDAVAEETVFGVSRQANDEWDFFIDPESKIGYIRLTQFTEESGRDIKKALSDLKDKDVKGLVLDLRFNPGGLLTSAIEIANLFIDDGLIVTVKPRVGKESHGYADGTGGYVKFPMAVIVNDGSASASEIVSACLQDHHRAIIVGERSYGKGSVQNIVDFKPTGGQIKMTTATFWRPSGKNLNKLSTKGTEEEDWGVIPDKGFKVKMGLKDRTALLRMHADQELIPGKPKAQVKDAQLDAALEYLRNQIKVAAKANGKKKAG